MLNNFGRTAGMSWTTGDFNADGQVDINDLTILLANFGQTYAAGIQAVPEPASAILLGIAGIGLMGFARRHARAGEHSHRRDDRSNAEAFFQESVP